MQRQFIADNPIAIIDPIPLWPDDRFAIVERIPVLPNGRGQPSAGRNSKVDPNGFSQYRDCTGGIKL